MSVLRLHPHCSASDTSHFVAEAALVLRDNNIFSGSTELFFEIDPPLALESFCIALAGGGVDGCMGYLQFDRVTETNTWRLVGLNPASSSAPAPVVALSGVLRPRSAGISAFATRNFYRFPGRVLTIFSRRSVRAGCRHGI